MKRALVLVVVLVAAFATTRSPADAQQPPVVRVSGTTDMGVHFQCFTEPTTVPGSFTLERDSTAGALTVTYHIAGGPTDLNADETAGADHTVDFADGEAAVTVTVHPAVTSQPQSATITVLDGTGYTVGDPASGELLVAVSTPSCVAPSDTLPRTGVRTTTVPLALGGMALVVIGSVALVAASRRRTPV